MTRPPTADLAKALAAGCLSVIAGLLVTALCIVTIGWLLGLGLRLAGL